MDLYNVMLVDDEEEVRQAIINRLDWEAIGFRVVDSAENGEEALEKAEMHSIDVVMTDIHMPFMDGLTFCKKLREKTADVKIVIFSGYDEFEYAKEAIKLEAEEYILKPIDATELKRVFQRIKERLDEEINQKRNVERLQQYYRESIPVLQEQMLIGLMEGRITEDKAQEYMKWYEIDIQAPYYAIGIFRPDLKNDEGSGALLTGVHSNLLPLSIKQIVEDSLKGSYHFRSMNYLGTIIVVAMLQEKTEFSGFIHSIDQICKTIKKVIQVNTSAGIGQLCSKLSEFHNSYNEAKDAVDYRILFDSNQAIYIKDVEPKAEERYVYDEASIQHIMKQIKIGSKEELEKSIWEITDKFKQLKVTSPQLQLSFAGILIEIARLEQAYEMVTDKIDVFDIDVYREIKKFNSLDEFGERLLEICLQLRSRIRRERTDSTRILITNAIQFITEQYSDTSLSVDKICNYLNVSAAYFSTLFKKETGMNFVMYLTKVRMEQALTLLNTTEEKSYIISGMVGYEEPNYFSYVFKKYYGVSPSKYRQNKVTADEKKD